MLNVAAIVLLTTTFVALLAGSVEITVGDTVTPVLKVQAYSVCNAFPIRSFTAVATLPVYVVLLFSFEAGVKVMVKFSALYVNEPSTLDAALVVERRPP